MTNEDLKKEIEPDAIHETLRRVGENDIDPDQGIQALKGVLRQHCGAFGWKGNRNNYTILTELLILKMAPNSALAKMINSGNLEERVTDDKDTEHSAERAIGLFVQSIVRLSKGGQSPEVKGAELIDERLESGGFFIPEEEVVYEPFSE
jgi:hypothetical protein